MNKVESKSIIECPDSPYNTPLFPVKNVSPSTGRRMVQDLQAVNKAIVPGGGSVTI